MNFDIFGGRKAFAFLVTIAIGTAVELIKPGGLTETMAMFLVGSAASFIAGNAALSWKGMQVQSSGEEDAVATVDLSPIENKIAELAGSQAALADTINQIGLATQNTNKILIGAMQKRTP